MKVKVYDKFRFEIPVYGNIIKIGSRDEGEVVCVRLTTTNNNKFPVGSEIWVHRAQCKAVVDKI